MSYDKISDDTKWAFMEMVIELDVAAPPKGIEMSVVTKNVCDPFVYPTPYELHFSNGLLEWYTEAPDDYIRKMNGVDIDLAAHFTIIRTRGRCLYGLPIEEVFGEVPKQDYLDSIRNDIAEARDEIKENPVYIILNLARVLAYCREALVLSKKEGGEWALDNLPVEFHGLIKNALREYAKSEDVVYDTDESERYAEYMLKQISSYQAN